MFVSRESGLVNYGIHDNLRRVEESRHTYKDEKREKAKVVIAAAHLSIACLAGEAGPDACVRPQKSVSILVMK